MRPPNYTVTTVQADKPASTLLRPEVLQALPWLQPPPLPTAVPIFDLPLPSTVRQIDPLTTSPPQTPANDIFAAYERHMRDSAVATLLAAGAASPHTVQLPAVAVAVAGWLARGAQLAWVGGKAVVKAGGKVLDVVGKAGGAWDLYQFLSWASEQGSKIKGPLPRGEYQPGSGLLVFTWPDGTEVAAPATQVPPYLRAY